MTDPDQLDPLDEAVPEVADQAAPESIEPSAQPAQPEADAAVVSADEVAVPDGEHAVAAVPIADPDERLLQLHQAKLAERAARPNWSVRIGLLTFVVIPVLIWALPRLMVVDEREERGLERALHYCDDSELDRCRERIAERHGFCFEYAEEKREKDAWTDFYGDCMHSMFGDFYLKVGDNILEK